MSATNLVPRQSAIRWRTITAINTALCIRWPKNCNREGIETTALLIQGEFAKSILQEAERLKVDFIAMGTHGHGAMHDLIVGSVGNAVIRDTTLPVLLVPLRKT